MSWPAPGSLNREPQEGDVYEFVHNSQSIVGYSFPQGSKLTLVKWTEEAPYRHEPTGIPFKDPAGNWLVDGPNGRTVWSSIRQMLAIGQIKLVMQLKTLSNDRRSRFNRNDVI